MVQSFKEQLEKKISKLEAKRKGYNKLDNRYTDTTKRISTYKRTLKDVDDERKQLSNKIKKLDRDSVEHGYNSVSINKPKRNSWLDFINTLKETGSHYKAIKIDGEYYTLTNETKKALIKMLNKGYVEEDIDIQYGSDVVFAKLLRSVDTNKIEVVSVPKKLAPIKKKLLSGRFFKYTHNIDKLDLTRYQIYETLDENSNKEVCFIHALIQSGLFEEELINKARDLCNVDNVPRRLMKTLAEKLNIRISVTNIYDNGEYKTISYNHVQGILGHLKLGLTDEHYFLNDNKTGISSYALDHYDEIKHLKDFTRICKMDKGYYKRANRYISSLQLFEFLLKNKESFLVKIDESSFKSNKVEKVEITTLDYLDDQCKAIEYNEKKDLDNPEWDHVYLDFETSTMTDDRKNLEKHEPYQVSSWRVEGGTNNLKADKIFNGEYCGLNLLESLKKNTVLFAHNFKYDINFIFKHTLQDNTVEREGKFITSTSYFYNQKTRQTIKLVFRDTWHMIGGKISDFAKKFKLEGIKKDIIPYSIYTPKSVLEKDYNIKKALKYIKNKDDKELFLNNIKEWDLETRKGFFNHIKYSEIYCKQDVNIMFQGYQVFKQWMFEVTGLNIVNYSTISSIAYDYGTKEGIFEGCYNLNGTPNHFINLCVVGGRCMVRENNKVNIKERIQDFDGVALYPSSMYTMGFLKGKPKIIKNLNYKNISKYDGYFVEIDITKINKTYKFPLLTRVNDKGIREFNNDLTGIHHVDKVTLEELIKYHKIEFKIIKGYYFNEGKNYKIQEVIKHLFETRLIKKKEGNPVQEAYKLAMNSIYGKTLMKYDPKEIQYKLGEENALGFISRNFNTINNWNKIDGANKYRIQSIKTINDHYSAPHIGCEVLSNSKRIMNRVMCLADDLGIKIYYQDTDSMHIQESGIERLNEEYKKLYGTELIGKAMCQFHCDFDFKCDEGKIPVSVHHIACGKKTYIDKVECIRNNKIEYEYHIRLKGIPRRSIDEIVKRDYDGDYMTLYEDMYEGKTIEFDLLCDDAVMFEFDKNFTVKNKDKFIRRYNISGEYDDEDDEL